MNVPSYQYLKVFELEDLRRELLKYNPLRHPLVIYIKEIENEEQALDLISDLINQKKFGNIPYPIYVISNIKKYLGSLILFDKTEKLPQFYNKKYRQPNSKELKVLDKTSLLNERFKFIKMNENKLILMEFAKHHKNLNVLSREGIFLENLLNKLD
jgi:hypothetical protein